MLNALIWVRHAYPRMEAGKLPTLEKNGLRLAPEGLAIGGLDLAETYLPIDRFANKNIDDENQYKTLVA